MRLNEWNFDSFGAYILLPVNYTKRQGVITGHGDDCDIGFIKSPKRTELFLSDRQSLVSFQQDFLFRPNNIGYNDIMVKGIRAHHNPVS